VSPKKKSVQETLEVKVLPKVGHTRCHHLHDNAMITEPDYLDNTTRVGVDGSGTCGVKLGGIKE
jgi:hypothetical protein